ncbi:MAG: hypothetical protein GX316_07500 [Firmicutes bacterium]|nr:hypothetical protein [Bacillota bacterium]
MLGVWWSFAAAYVGAVVGAGFASGQESLTFFVVYGHSGLMGIILVSVGFMLMGGFSFMLAHALGDGSYRRVLEVICGTGWAKYYDIVVTCFLLAGVGVMLAGAGSLMQQQWGIHPLVGIIATACFTGASCIKGAKGVLFVNGLLVPVISVCAIVLGVNGLLKIWPSIRAHGLVVLWKSAPSALIPNWWLSGLIYLAYNSMLGIAACIPVAATLPSRRFAFWGGMGGGLLLGILLLTGSLALWGRGSSTANSPIPLALVADGIHPIFGNVYGIAIWFAMLTTAVTNLFAVVQRYGSGTQAATVGMFLSVGLVLSLVGFGYLIGLLYPIFGYLGSVYVAKSLVYFSKDILRQTNRRK